MTAPLALDDPQVATLAILANRAIAFGTVARWGVHALRNPLQSLSLVGELVRGGDAGALEGPIGANLLGALRQLARAGDVVDEATRLPPPASPAEPVALGDVTDLLERLVGAHRGGAEFEVDPAIRAVPAVRGEPDALLHLLLNLVLNGVESAGEREGARVRLLVTVTERTVRVRVEDNGPGVAPAMAGRLFEPFATTKTRRAVAGLGLPVARLLAGRAGGTVRYDDAAPPGGGAAFTAELVRWDAS